MDLLVGAPARSLVSSTEEETETSRLDRARAVFEGDAAAIRPGKFTRYCELLEHLEKLLTSP
jgi:hypothetical protein